MLRRRLFNWVFYGHLWIALAATSLAWLTLRITYGDQEWASEAPLLTFVFLATLGVYTLHRHLSFQRAGVRPSARRYELVAHHPQASLLVGLGSTLGAVLIGLTFLHAMWDSLLWAIPVTVFYLTPPLKGWRRLRDLPYLKNIWVAWAWSIMTVMVPVAVMGEAIQTSYNSSGLTVFAGPTSLNLVVYQLEIISRFLFTGCIALLFDLRDVPLDRAQGVITVAGTKPTLHRFLVYGSLIISAVISLNYTHGCVVPAPLGITMSAGYLTMLPVAYYTYFRTDENWYAMVVNGLLLLPPLLFALVNIFI